MPGSPEPNINMSEIRQLLGLINDAVDTLEKTCAANGTKIPSLYEPFHPASEAFREDPVSARATMIISTAALQLAAVVLPPNLSLYNIIGGVSEIVILLINDFH